MTATPATAPAPIESAFQALQRLNECQGRMATAIFQGWVAAQAEMTSLFWRITTIPDAEQQSAAVRATDDTIRTASMEVASVLSREVESAMADAEALLGRPVEAPVAVAVAVAVHLPGATFAYCVRCKESREMANPVATVMKNGKHALKGSCRECGSGMFRIGKG